MFEVKRGGMAVQILAVARGKVNGNQFQLKIHTYPSITSERLAFCNHSTYFGHR